MMLSVWVIASESAQPKTMDEIFRDMLDDKCKVYGNSADIGELRDRANVIDVAKKLVTSIEPAYPETLNI